MPDPTPSRVVPLTVAPRTRPDPPDDLTKRAADLWRAIVSARRPGWIDNPGAMLTLGLYVRACVVAEDLCRRASRDKAFIGKLNRQTNVVLRMGKELGLL